MSGVSMIPDSRRVQVVAFLTTGRVNPAISAAMGFFLLRYKEIAPNVRLVAFRNGFRGLLTDDVIAITERELAIAHLLLQKGGSPIGGSRVRLSNVQHMRAEGLLNDGEDPFERCAAMLVKHSVSVLHVIGSTSALKAGKQIADLLRTKHQFDLTVVGIPKTIENDIGPVRRTLGALTAAKSGAQFFNNIVAEHHANPRMLIIHEIKGRAGGWLTAATALAYRNMTAKERYAPALGLAQENYEIHAVYTPEMHIDLLSEIGRLRRVMDRADNVNIFVAQGTFSKQIEEDAKDAGKPLPKHPRLGYTLTEPAAWLAAKIKGGIAAEKVLIQKSGIYVRAQEADREDLVLAQSLVDAAVSYALQRRSGVVGHDDGHDGRLRNIEHERLVSGKPFDVSTPWFVELLAAIGQPQASTSLRAHFASRL